jgi:tellurite resistance protein
MNSTVNPSYTDTQISAWLRGLLTVAWADGHFDPEEQDAIALLTQEELAPCTDLGELGTIRPDELAANLGGDAQIAENFLRTAVVVAIADGTYSASEAEVLHQFQVALGLQLEALQALQHTLYDPAAGEIGQTAVAADIAAPKEKADVLNPLKHWLDRMDVDDPRVARFICKMVPAQCPFERDVVLFGHKVVHIPPMCKLNPLYDQLVGLRFRALSYLADERGEDVSKYC